MSDIQVGTVFTRAMPLTDAEKAIVAKYERECAALSPEVRVLVDEINAKLERAYLFGTDAA